MQIDVFQFCPICIHPAPQLYLNACICMSAQSCLTLCKCMDGSSPCSVSKGLSKQEYWNGLPFPPPGDLPNPRTEPTSLASLVLAIGFFTTGTTWETIMSECPGVNTIQLYAIRQDTRQRRTFGKISKFGKSLLACSNFLVHISNIIYRASKSEAQRKDRYHIVEKSNSWDIWK